ncbi:GNAT family N-acetyltransferase [Lacinutrix jangbogonensis]|uniref:GNAT family N-acetyltransferase n=1 Tax=Lacinutrix jangbogonensis TaxID=1469557 RepID=UPI00053D0852|nr:GNAT family protein [Lacinutrix jangbogonensis]
MIQAFNGFEINPIHQGDAWKLCDFMIVNADRFKRYFPNTLKENLNPTLSQLFVETKLRQFSNKEVFLFTLKHTETRKLAAIVYIKELDWSIKRGEFAYCIDYNFKGNGLIAKAIEALSKHAFTTLKLQTLQIIVHKDNLPSINVGLNNGFTWQKTLLKEFTPNGEQPLDMELYELYK